MAQLPPLIAADTGALAALAAERIQSEVVAAVRLRGRCSLALAGGSTPRPVYERLASPEFSRRMPWEKVAIYFGDERCVPPEHPESNYRMVRDALLERLPGSPAAVHRIEAEDPDRERAAAAYAKLLPARIDLLLLGMGSDGHTASLFPGSPALGERVGRVCVAQSPRPPTWRITVTPPVIAEARSVIVLVRGEEKSAMVARVLKGGEPPEKLPVTLARHGLWILDRGAASKLVD